MYPLNATKWRIEGHVGRSLVQRSPIPSSSSSSHDTFLPCRHRRRRHRRPHRCNFTYKLSVARQPADKKLSMSEAGREALPPPTRLLADPALGLLGSLFALLPIPQGSLATTANSPTSSHCPPPSFLPLSTPLMGVAK